MKRITRSTLKGINPTTFAKSKLTHFLELVFRILQKLGWIFKQGSRKTVFYIFPPSTYGNLTSKLRIDYFDSVAQVIGFIQTSSKRELHDAVQQFKSVTGYTNVKRGEDTKRKSKDGKDKTGLEKNYKKEVSMDGCEDGWEDEWEDGWEDP